MVHRIVWRVGAEESLDFWEQRLAARDVATERSADGGLVYADPEGLAHELVVAAVPDAPLVADAPDIPAEHALQGFDGARAYAADPERSSALLRETLGFTGGADGSWEVRGDERGGHYVYDPAPSVRPIPGAGTVHHIAFATQLDEHDAWQQRLTRAGARATPVIDRFYFRSIYFREPSGVLFELATIGPGFGADEDPAHLGERLSLPPKFERLRDELERKLTPLPDPRARKATA
jgi:glyoxalase family protein